MTNGAAWGILILRVVLGVILLMHGYLAFAILGPAAMVNYMPRMGFPPGMAMALTWYLIAAHGVGGALIIVGLWTRLAAFVNVPVMAAAVALLHGPEGFFVRAVVVDAAAGTARAIGYEFSLLVLACLVAVVFVGGGPLSIDRVRHVPARRR